MKGHLAGLLAPVLALAMAGCAASGNPASGFTGSGGSGATGSSSAGAAFTGDGGGNQFVAPLDAGSGVTGAVAIAPANPVIQVVIQDGVVTPSTVPFKASLGGGAVAATWSLDRGDLGTIDRATGAFVASGVVAGTGVVTAQVGGAQGTTMVTVQITSTRNGGPSWSGDAGIGGYGGVGGEGPGGATDAGVFAPATAPGSASELGFLYPYDKTVWPRGMLAPLLQWQTTHMAQAVGIHLTQKDFEFKGQYALSPALTGAQRMRQPLDQQAWDQATHSNEGDPLHVEVTIAAADGVFGPIAEDWTVAPGILQGTVYYASYNTALNTENGNVAGAVLAMQPGNTSPTLAIPSLAGHCHVCHEVSANGSTLFTDDDISGNWGYGGSYDLTQGGTPITRWDGSDGGPPGLGPSQMQGRFTYSGVYPDGTFVLANTGDNNWWEYQSDSNLFARNTLLPIASTGFTNLVSEAVTPAFSPDGQHVAFNFWQAQSGVDAGVAPGSGHSLVAMDFNCGAAAGSVTCANPPFAFSNLREIYRDATRYAGWPSFTPDGNSVVLQSTITGSTMGSVLNTYQGGTAELMIVDARQPPQFSAQRLCALNGFESDCATPYLPVVPNHPNDTVYSYEPTVNPVATGGYSWVVFTTRRAYGNVAQGDPYESYSYTAIDHPITKKLWIAAIDENPVPGKDPSHPAFYLPGQELNAGNMKGYFVVEPCRADGSACLTGDQCCHGFCRTPADGGPLACTSVVTGCSNEYEKCQQASDCCGVAQGYLCIDGLCAQPPPTR